MSQQTPMDLPEAKARVAAWLGQHFFLRFHLALILGMAFIVGLLTTKVLETVHMLLQ